MISIYRPTVSIYPPVISIYPLPKHSNSDLRSNFYYYFNLPCPIIIMVRLQVTTLKCSTRSCNNELIDFNLPSHYEISIYRPSKRFQFTMSRILWNEFYGTEFQFTIGFLVFPDFNLPDSKFKSRTEIRPRGRR